MNVGMIGLGKLGLPVAVAIASKGHRVYGYDTNAERMRGPPWPFQEGDDFDGLFTGVLAQDTLRFSSPTEIVFACPLIFVAVQTPHARSFEGVTPLSEDRADFDYTYLMQAIRDLDAEANLQARRPTVAVISTVLPGTMRLLIEPLCPNLEPVYNPAFPAMGSVVQDYLYPEFVLLGTDGPCTAGIAREFYEGITDAPILETSIVTAESIKVLYNTYITAKIILANTAMEVCHKTGANVDDVSRAWALATRRITSPAYLCGGMGDGGACHPRDNIALSWLARELDLSYDLFGALMEAREAQAAWLCGLVLQHTTLPPFILGTAFKAGSNIETGSAALLCKYILTEALGHEVGAWDPYVIRGKFPSLEPRCFLVACNHPVFADLQFPRGSVVIDPWRMIADQPGVDVIRVGE